MIDRRFISGTLDEVRLAVGGLVGWMGLHIEDKPVARSRARRASGRLKALERLVRRLILIMALPLMGRIAQPGEIRTLWDGEHAPARVRPNRCRLRLAPASLIPPAGAALPDFAGFAKPSRVCPVSLIRLKARIEALVQVLDAPEVYAVRLARHLSRLREEGVPAPLILPTLRFRGGSPELALAAGAIPEVLRQALEVWDTS